MPQRPHLATMWQNVVNSLLLDIMKETYISQHPTPPLKLI